MITTPEEANKSYQEFKTLQQQWREIKNVPAEKANELYKNATLVPIHGADHCFVGYLDELYDAIKGFLIKM